MIRTAVCVHKLLRAVSTSFSTVNSGVAYGYGDWSTTSSVKVDTNSLVVNWDHGKEISSRFHYDWLRDNCGCDKCRNPKTGQRILRTTEDARPDSVHSGDDRVKIEWRDGHSSQFILSWLLENSYCHHNIDNIKPVAKKPAQTLWDAEYFSNRELPSVDYEEYMKSNEVLLKMLQNFRQFGLCFIHNTPVSEEATGDALRRIGPLRRTYYGDLWTMVAGSMTVKLVNNFVHTYHQESMDSLAYMELCIVDNSWYNGQQVRCFYSIM